MKHQPSQAVWSRRSLPLHLLSLWNQLAPWSRPPNALLQELLGRHKCKSRILTDSTETKELSAPYLSKPNKAAKKIKNNINSTKVHQSQWSLKCLLKIVYRKLLMLKCGHGIINPIILLLMWAWMDLIWTDLSKCFIFSLKCKTICLICIFIWFQFIHLAFINVCFWLKMHLTISLSTTAVALRCSAHGQIERFHLRKKKKSALELKTEKKISIHRMPIYIGDAKVQVANNWKYSSGP